MPGVISGFTLLLLSLLVIILFPTTWWIEWNDVSVTSLSLSLVMLITSLGAALAYHVYSCSGYPTSFTKFGSSEGFLE